MLKHKDLILLLFLFLSILFTACGTKPGNVLSDKKMEEVLYDLYMAEVIMEANPTVFTNDSVRKQDMLNSVFKKHKISEQEFDSTMSWYAANLDRYFRINDKVIARYTSTEEKLKKGIDSLALKQAEMEEQVLFKEPYFTLQTPGMFQNRYTFLIEEPELEFVREIKIHFSVSGASEEISPEMNLLIFTKGKEAKTIRHQESISSEGTQTFTYSIPPTTPMTSIYGFIEIPDSLQNKILFTNFLIMKEKPTLKEVIDHKIPANERISQ
jgi:hypothetical protein